jgi:hypothetical protein
MLDIEKLATFLVKLMKDALGSVETRVKALEERDFPYKGVYQRSNEYERGVFVTFKGSMWYCCVDTTRQQPGKGSDWQLAVKGSE